MPVRFQCDGCGGKLSISRRKIGMSIECPRCMQPLTVPGMDAIQDEIDLLLESAKPKSRKARSPDLNKVVVTETPGRGESAAPSVPVPKSRSQKSSASPPKRLEDLPLFEGDELDRLLESSPKVQAEPVVEVSVPLPVQASSTRIVDHDAIVFTRTKASLAILGIAALLAAMFAIGYVVGKG